MGVIMAGRLAAVWETTLIMAERSLTPEAYMNRSTARAILGGLDSGYGADVGGMSVVMGAVVNLMLQMLFLFFRISCPGIGGRHLRAPL